MGVSLEPTNVGCSGRETCEDTNTQLVCLPPNPNQANSRRNPPLLTDLREAQRKVNTTEIKVLGKK